MIKFLGCFGNVKDNFFDEIDTVFIKTGKIKKFVDKDFICKIVFLYDKLKEEENCFFHFEKENILIFCDGYIISPKLSNNKKNYHFFSTIKELYENLDEEFLKELDGAFAIGLVDFKNKRCIFGRDIYGCKFFYVSILNDYVVFSNDLNLIKSFKKINLEINLQALYEYLALFFIPAPLTFYKNIKLLKPCELYRFQIENENCISYKSKDYFNWVYEPTDKIKFSEEFQKIENFLNFSLRKQLEGYSKIGCLLSGGLDSSLVSIFANRNFKGDIFTLSASFKEKSYDESYASDEVAKTINSRHNKIIIDDIKIGLEDILDILKSCGQPYGDSSLFALTYLLKFARKEVEVVLTGEGGDEAFGINKNIFKIYRYDSMPFLVRKLIYYILLASNKVKLIPNHYLTKLEDCLDSDLEESIKSLYIWLRKKELKKIIKNNNFLSTLMFFEPLQIPDLKILQKKKYFISYIGTMISINLMLPNDFLFKNNMASYLNNIEIVHPLLNKELFQLGINLNYKYKLNKKLIKEFALNYLSKRLVYRPKKGFGTPIDNWFNNDIKKGIYEILMRKNSTLKSLLNEEIYKGWVESFCWNKKIEDVSRIGLYQRVNMLLSLSLFI